MLQKNKELHSDHSLHRAQFLITSPSQRSGVTRHVFEPLAIVIIWSQTAILRCLAVDLLCRLNRDSSLCSQQVSSDILHGKQTLGVQKEKM